MIHKTCPSCHKPKIPSAETWHRDASLPDGWARICRLCARSASKKERNRMKLYAKGWTDGKWDAQELDRAWR